MGSYTIGTTEGLARAPAPRARGVPRRQRAAGRPAGVVVSRLAAPGVPRRRRVHGPRARRAGAVALVCGLEAPFPVLRALAAAAGNAIETELRLAATTHERCLLDAYLRAHGGREPVAVLDGRTRIVSDAAAALLRPRDLDMLESYAIEAARDGRPRSATLT